MNIRTRIETALTSAALPFQWLVRPPQQPCVTYAIFNESADLFGDGIVHGVTFYVDIDIFGAVVLDDHVSTVRIAMEAQGFRKYTGPQEDWDYEAKLYRVTMQFTYSEDT